LGRKRIKKKRRIPEHARGESSLIHGSYNIVFDPIEDEPKKYIDPELEKAQEEIYNSMREDPEGCASRLGPLMEKYPDYPVLYNYLSVSYTLMGETEKARDNILKAYRKFPDYLFAKIGYVELCLRENKLDEIPRILDNKYDLKLHYPERTEFHITEFTAFAGTVGFYFCLIGKPEVAETYYKMLKKVAPDDPQTRRIGRTLKAIEPIVSLGKLIESFRK